MRKTLAIIFKTSIFGILVLSITILVFFLLFSLKRGRTNSLIYQRSISK